MQRMEKEEKNPFLLNTLEKINVDFTVEIEFKLYLT